MKMIVKSSERMTEVVIEKSSVSEIMAVPKKRRSKTKGKTRLSNWKRKAMEAARKAYNVAKRSLGRGKEATASLENENSEKTISSFDSASEVKINGASPSEVKINTNSTNEVKISGDSPSEVKIDDDSPSEVKINANSTNEVKISGDSPSEIEIDK